MLQYILLTIISFLTQWGIMDTGPFGNYSGKLSISGFFFGTNSQASETSWHFFSQITVGSRCRYSSCNLNDFALAHHHGPRPHPQKKKKKYSHFGKRTILPRKNQQCFVGPPLISRMKWYTFPIWAARTPSASAHATQHSAMWMVALSVAVLVSQWLYWEPPAGSNIICQIKNIKWWFQRFLLYPYLRKWSNSKILFSCDLNPPPRRCCKSSKRPPPYTHSTVGFVEWTYDVHIRWFRNGSYLYIDSWCREGVAAWHQYIKYMKVATQFLCHSFFQWQWRFVVAVRFPDSAWGLPVVQNDRWWWIHAVFDKHFLSNGRFGLAVQLICFQKIPRDLSVTTKMTDSNDLDEFQRLNKR